LRFEYKGFVGTKSFRIVTIVFIVVIIAATSIPQIAGAIRSAGVGSGEGGGFLGGSNKAALILSGEALINEVYKAAFQTEALKNTGAVSWIDLSGNPPGEAALEEALKNGEYLFAVRYSGGTGFEFFAAGNRMASYEALGPITEYITEVARKAQIAALPAGEREAAERISSLAAEPKVIEVGGNAGDNFLLGYIIIMFMLYTIIGYSNYVSSSVVTEKTSKAMELLITAVKPIHLMVGKVIGVGLAALTQVGAIIAAFVIGVVINFSYWQETNNTLLGIVQSGNVGGSIAFILIAYFLMGFFLYAFLIAALASTVSRPEEASTVVLLPTLMLLASLLIGFLTLSGSMNKEFIAGLSYFPFFTPICMLARFTIGDAGLPQLLLGAGILIVAIVIVAILAAKIFRVGVMLYGVKATPRQLFKAIKNA